MDLRSIIDEIASQADDFLAGAANRKEARAGKKVAEDVMAILENEGFFEFGSSGGSRGPSADESAAGE
jgi:hypothetical protein